MIAAPGVRHQLVVGNRYALLRAHVQGRDLGTLTRAPTDCSMSDITVVQLDIVYVARADAGRTIRPREEPTWP